MARQRLLWEWLLSKMFPAAGTKLLSATLRIPREDCRAARDLSDLRNGDSRDLFWDALAPVSGEQQLIVLATMQAKIEVDFS